MRPEIRSLANGEPGDEEVIPDGSISGPIEAVLRVDWSQTVARAGELLFGSNDILIADPADGPGDLGYAERIEQIGLRLLRFHGWNPHGWFVDQERTRWDERKIAASYHAPYLRGKTVIQTIFDCPKALERADEWPDAARYAAHCAELVDIVNNRLGRQVAYWEPMNEWDMRYAEAGRFDELCDLYNQCAEAMKRADPRIKVGGLAFTWADVALIEPFLQKCAANIDFISWHTYGTGDRKTATDLIMSNTHSFGGSVRSVRQLAERYIPNRTIELSVNEYNVNYAWENPDKRQWNNIGAVFMASVLKHMAEAGLEMGATWNLKDGTYGMIDPQNAMRHEATVYAWANRHLVGDVVRTESSHVMVEVFAVHGDGAKGTILLINKSAGSATVRLQSGWEPTESPITSAHLGEESVARVGTVPAAAVFGAPLEMPPYSLLLLRA